MAGKLEYFIKDERIIKDLLAPKSKLIMVLGGADTGKTTLVEGLADFLAKKKAVGIVDTDLGQSHLGLPTTIGWGKVQKQFTDWQSVAVEDFYFTGAFSPIGSLLPAVTGTKLMTDSALSACNKVIVDTTGLIAEPAGRVLKQYKIDALSPDIILALERSQELGHILGIISAMKTPKIYRLPVPEGVEAKSIQQRSQYRFDRLKAYFTGSHTLEALCDTVGVRFSRDPLKFTPEDLKGRIISFRNEKNADISLGMIVDVDAKERKLTIRTPLSKDTKFSTVVIGTVQFESKKKS
ncbi:MAG: hypothetical protein HZA14_00630 [Nitrospirae bacterium]|nr:hypothetical protein [Nitrospirota bacterium]